MSPSRRSLIAALGLALPLLLAPSGAALAAKAPHHVVHHVMAHHRMVHHPVHHVVRRRVVRHRVVHHPVVHHLVKKKG